MEGQGLTLDAWSLVFENVEKEDLCNLCLVSRLFHAIATRILYRCITMVEPDSYMDFLDWDKPPKTDPPQGGHWNLLSRLEDDANEDLRSLVQELILCHPPGRRVDSRFLRHLRTDDRLSKLIASLPNLRRVRIELGQLQSDHVFRTISEHSRHPELILELAAGYHAFAPDQPRPYVSSLSVTVNPFEEHNGPNERMLAVQQLFLNCSNLRSLALTVFRYYGGCVVIVPRYPIISTFQLTGEEQFPPLRELSLDGYIMSEEEWLCFRKCVQWSKLSALTLGPQSSNKLPGRLAGYATSLTSLKISSYADEGNEDPEGLERLLMSFDTLTTLELKGYICSVEAIGHHRNLSTLYLHEDEPACKGVQRKVLSVEELEYLDKQCSRLRSLAVDVQRGDNRLPEDVFQKLATGFKSLKELSIHFELGLVDIHAPITPPLNYATARNIGQAIFNERKHAGIPVGPPFMVTLWTGSCFRRFPQWEPGFSRFERAYTATYELRLPNDPGRSSEVQLRHLQKERLDEIQRGKSRREFYDSIDLAEQVKCAVEGPKSGPDAPPGL
ncbi:hypothetical protein BJX61DRAFT_535770 [Aspergillus egyptiacus]|nr:hypothetical protein BJX61DRAFT_535770 [Aspergillus egyptiacus]